MNWDIVWTDPKGRWILSYATFVSEGIPARPPKGADLRFEGVEYRVVDVRIDCDRRRAEAVLREG